MSAAPRQLALEHRLATQPLAHGDGFRAIGVRGDVAWLDPFLMVDHFHMSQPTFGAHPHAGLCAVTYLFEDAQTGFQNRDSLGDASVIRPGDMHWTTGGSGILHDEVPLQPGLSAHGLQIFVNLPAAQKWMAPGSIHIERERMPTWRQPTGAQVRLVFGSIEDGLQRRGPVEMLPSPASLVDAALPATGSFSCRLAAGQRAFVLCVEGIVAIGDEVLQRDQAAALEPGPGELVISAASAGWGDEGPARVAVFIGTALREPVVRQGPFAMSNEEDLRRAFAAFRSGAMGRL